LEHTFFFDGNSKKIAWIIQTNDSRVKQQRDHPNNYLGKVTTLQSKYIALHVGMFWGIGRFIMNNEDNITIKIDDKFMFDHLSKNEISPNEFIKTRTKFIKQFIQQRKLKITYETIEQEENLAFKLL
jgi:hypothetical protein